MKHLLKMLDLTSEEVIEILNLADQLKYEQKHGIAHKHLAGKSLGLIFEKASTRTRVSFPFFKGYADWQGRASAGYRKSSFTLP